MFGFGTGGSGGTDQQEQKKDIYEGFGNTKESVKGNGS